MFAGDVAIPIPMQSDLVLKPELTPRGVAQSLELAAARVDGTVPDDEMLAAARQARALGHWYDLARAAGTFIGLVAQRSSPPRRAAVWRRLSMALTRFQTR